MKSDKNTKSSKDTRQIATKANKVSFDVQKIKESLQTYSREPFVDFVRQALENAPADADIADMAKYDPEKWVNYVTKLARLYGYSDTMNVNHTHRVIHEMTSSEIDQEINAIIQRARLVEPSIDVESTRIS